MVVPIMLNELITKMAEETQNWSKYGESKLNQQRKKKKKLINFDDFLQG